MLGLKLRSEFETDKMRDTAIVFHREDGTGALDIDANAFFEITYPTEDVQRALGALAEGPECRPIVLLGERGRGKSHILAAMYHAVASPEKAEKWAHEWENRLGKSQLTQLTLRRGYLPIAEAFHNYEYDYLWDLLFERHPLGQKSLGKWEQSGGVLPRRSLLEEMFSYQPVVLILDEFQTWYEGQYDEPGDTGKKRRTWAFTFIQILSELAKERPDLLILVISVRNNHTDAYRQVHRDNPLVIDFKGSMARVERKRLALHRLFENRRQVNPGQIRDAVHAYSEERFRLLYQHVAPGDFERIMDEVVESWPFSPELFDLLEDQILLSEAAQGSRDLIKVLARIYRERGDATPIITPADFDVTTEAGGVQTLLDALVDEHKNRLREVAQRNLKAVEEAGVHTPHAREIISALWVRSLSPGHKVGATPAELQLDITRAASVDDNGFADELGLIREHSFNIHEIGHGGGVRLQFQEEENARAKLKVQARNDQLFAHGEDIRFIRDTLRHLLTPTATESPSRVIVLGPNWQSDPWTGLETADQPDAWDRPALLVLPEYPADLHTILGTWLKQHMTRNRNTVRFLLPKAGKASIYEDQEVVLAARAAWLARQYAGGDATYKELFGEFDGRVRGELEGRFDRFAVLQYWDFQDPTKSRFHVEPVGKKKAEIPADVERSIRENLFAFEEFEALVRCLAEKITPVGKLLEELREPPSKPDKEAIPYLGETQIREKLFQVAKTGTVYLNVDGSWIGKRPEHENDEATLRWLQQKASRVGKDLAEIKIGTWAQVGGSTPGALQVQGAAGTLGGSIADTAAAVGEAGTVTPTNCGVPASGTTGGAPGVVPHMGFSGATGVADAAQGTAPNTVAGPSGTVGIGNVQATATSTGRRRSEAKNGLNLSAEFEAWGFKPMDRVPVARLEFRGLTVQELKTLLQKLPPVIKATLEVDSEA